MRRSTYKRLFDTQVTIRDMIISSKRECALESFFLRNNDYICRVLRSRGPSDKNGNVISNNINNNDLSQLNNNHNNNV